MNDARLTEEEQDAKYQAILVEVLPAWRRLVPTVRWETAIIIHNHIAMLEAELAELEGGT